MIETPEIIHTSAQQTAIIHMTIPRCEIQTVMGPGIGEIMETVKEQGVGPAGPWFTHHLTMGASNFDFEICVPVSAPVTAVGRVRPGEWPATKVARTVYRGPFEGLGTAWVEFDKWVRANGHTPRADLYECYISGPESGPDAAQWRTDLCRPLEP